MDAQLNGIPLAIETLKDSFPKAIVRHQIPYLDGAVLEDMGLKERMIRLRCYFWDGTFTDHKKLLALLWGQTEFELTHPVYGLLKGKVENIDVRADDSVDTAEIDLDFVVGESPAPEPMYADVGGEAGEHYVEGLSAATETYRADLKGALPAEIVEMPLDPEKSILEQMRDGLSLPIREYLGELDAMVNGFDAKMAAVMNPVNSLIADVNFLTDIPGRVMGSIARVAERIALGIDTLKNAPGRFLDGFRDGMAELRAVFPKDDKKSSATSGESTTAAASPAEKAVLAVTALTASKALAEIFAADEIVRQKTKQLEGVKRFDEKGRLKPVEKPGVPLNAHVVEASVAKARQMTMEAVAVSRENVYLKRMADSVLTHAAQIKLASETIVRIETNGEMPLHLVCIAHGLPYQAAERIMLINRFQNPNAVSGKVAIYAT